MIARFFHLGQRPLAWLVCGWLGLATGCGRHTLIQESSSMEPTIPRFSKIVVNTAAYRREDPRRWEIIMYEPLNQADTLWLHRVVGLPGETISFDERGVLINGKLADLPPRLHGIVHTLTNATVVGPKPLPHPYQVPKDSYYVLGDNPAAASDSRFWGAIHRRQIRGRVLEPE